MTFTQSGESYVVPGYYAANGDAGNTGASAGNKWRVHFSPPSIGTWKWRASFRKGAGIAASSAGGTSTHFDGKSGGFKVSASNKSGDDFRAKGLKQSARYVRVSVERYGELPEWHSAYGGGDGYDGEAWLFVDEILVNAK